VREEKRNRRRGDVPRARRGRGGPAGQFNGPSFGQLGLWLTGCQLGLIGVWAGQFG
jgi:hypothetical protein